MMFRIFSNLLYYGIAFPILFVLTKVVYNLKIEGKENIKNIKGGVVTISNHVLVLDCSMIGLACKLRKVCYTAQEESFSIPFVGKLIRLLNAIPIPKELKKKKEFVEEVKARLSKGDIVHFYPEGVLIPYCKEIREFRNGAFEFAVKNQVPLVPMVFTFREPQGIRRYFKKKQDVTLTVLEPITKVSNKEELKKKAQCAMEKERRNEDE